MDKRNIVNLAQIMLPYQANVAGNVHGGEIMKMMDTAAGAVAIKYSKSNSVTARVDELQFHLPIFVGTLVSCTATVVHTGRSSMEVYVSVTSEDLHSDSGPQKALSAYFTMVAIGKSGRPQPVPEFKPETEEEHKLNEEAKLRVAGFKLKSK
jgi:acyl-CoA hydrolase